MIRSWFRQAAVPWKTTATQTRASGENRVSTKPGVLQVRRFQAFTMAWPWAWTPEQVETWSGSGGWAHSTIRSYQGALAVFLDYVCDARYGWLAECEQRVGARPVQVCHEWNTAAHVADYEGRAERRPLTRVELQAFLDAADDRVESAALSGRKGWLAAFRDATLFKTVYGWGLRRREAVMLDVCDFTVNPAAPELGGFGACQVRFGKAMRGSPPRRRVVATVMPWAAQALEEYLAEVRPRYGCDAHPAVWLTVRAARISARQVDDRFAQFRALAGLPPELSVHCLRHSYVSVLPGRCELREFSDVTRPYLRNIRYFQVRQLRLRRELIQCRAGGVASGWIRAVGRPGS